jgi:hypothetical protein
VVRWSIGNMDRVLSVMWSVPYNRQLWSTWCRNCQTFFSVTLPQKAVVFVLRRFSD